VVTPVQRSLAAMTTTDTLDMTPPSPHPVRRLRRSRNDRIGAGVAGGLGDYFGVDPVLFRVLFATAAFFGGAGVLAYLLAWAAIPEEGTERAAIDGWVSSLRRRRVPFWLVAAGAAFLFWLIAFSWWAPGPFVPVIIVVIILVAILGRRARHDLPPPTAAVSLSKDDAAPAGRSGDAPEWVGETRKWMREAREHRRARLRRALPLKITTLVTFVVAMVVLGLVDAAHGIALTTYFWVAAAILGAGLIVGLAMRRASWSVALLLVPTVIGLIGFAGTNVSLRDGIGQKQWKPATTLGTHYKLAFGQAVLDLRSLAAQSVPSDVRIDVAGGQVEILAPKSLNVIVHANVRFGDISINGQSFDDGPLRSHGVNVTRTIDAPTGARGAAINIDVHLSDGNIDIRRS
jgi:phage shock protein PspC (stress-responsive transcriptional regulator)/FtsH-binding integral membrane protein